MTDEVYRPPESELIVESEARQNQFYVVSRKKLAVLYLTTLGFYGIYWFYVNWRNCRDAFGIKIMPIPRAIFYIFFTHTLFNRVDALLKENKTGFEWSPKLWATCLVVLAIVSNILDRLAYREIGSPATDILTLVILPFTLFILLKAQEAINLSQDDREGMSNSRFTIANYFWMVLGILFWLLLVAMLLDIFGLISLEV